MSSKLNLVPELPVFIGHSILFLANIAVVHKLFVKPYLELKNKRLAVTSGSESQAMMLINTARASALEVDVRLAAAFSETAAFRAEKRANAQLQKSKIVELAESELESEMETFKRELKEEIALKRSELSSIIDKLTHDAVAKVIQ